MNSNNAIQKCIYILFVIVKKKYKFAHGKEKKIMQLDIREIAASKFPKKTNKIPKFVYSFLNRWLCIKEINCFLKDYENLYGVDFVNAILFDSYHANITITGQNNIPKDERITIASNHPLGGFDGLALIHAASTCQDNLAFPVNDFLTFIPNLKQLFVPINKVGSNSKNIKELEECFASDKTILYFPAGLCSRRIKGKIVDLQWKKTFIKQSVLNHRMIVPTYIDGKNSNAFYITANIRKFLKIKFNIEMSMLPREMFKQKNKNIHIIFGKPIPWQKFDSSKNEMQWADSVKEFVYTLKDNPDNIFN